jgi:hypothetical protein
MKNDPATDQVWVYQMSGSGGVRVRTSKFGAMVQTQMITRELRKNFYFLKLEYVPSMSRFLYVSGIVVKYV